MALLYPRTGACQKIKIPPYETSRLRIHLSILLTTRSFPWGPALPRALSLQKLAGHNKCLPHIGGGGSVQNMRKRLASGVLLEWRQRGSQGGRNSSLLESLAGGWPGPDYAWSIQTSEPEKHILHLEWVQRSTFGDGGDDDEWRIDTRFTVGRFDSFRSRRLCSPLPGVPTIQCNKLRCLQLLLLQGKESASAGWGWTPARASAGPKPPERFLLPHRSPFATDMYIRVTIHLILPRLSCFPT